MRCCRAHDAGSERTRFLDSLYRRPDNDAFLLTETVTAGPADIEALLRDLGPPDRKLDQLVGRHADAQQWIYASRGLTLYVREHNWTIASVAGYAPSSANYYERYLGAHDQRRYSAGGA